jgi:OmpA-OmpF porin, OOP family
MKKFEIKKLVVVISAILFHVQVEAKDHPLMSGPTGYKIEDTQTKDFGNFSEGVLNKFTCEKDAPCADSVPGFKDGKFIAEGKYTQIRYVSQSPAGDLVILRSYENAFKKIGGRKLTARDSAYGSHLFFVEKDKKRIWMALDNGDSFVYLTFIEEKAAEQIATAGQLADSILKQGFATLYINFDNNKSTIKIEDQPALKEVVQLLKNDSTLKLSVEGHTDNIGAVPANKTLSSERAKSVMEFLVSGGINNNRLSAKGLGSEAPIADNRTDEGRAKNRRVELVKVK